MSSPDLICPECGETAQELPPTDLVPWRAHGLDRPRFSHLDGSSLCPVIGYGGYALVEPVTRPAGPGDDR